MKAGNTVWSLTNLDLLKVLFLVELALAERDSKAACKRTQHCWPTTPNIVACYILRPFAHPVACCWMLLRVVAQSLKPVKLLAPCKRTQHCWELLRPFARSLSLQGLLVVAFPWCTAGPNIVWSCCIRFHTSQPTLTQQFPTLLAQQCWRLLPSVPSSIFNQPFLPHKH